MLVSAAISGGGAPRELVLLWYEGAFELVVSYELLFELQSVLLREKFRRHRPERDVLDYVMWLRDNATLESEGEIRPLSRDPEDDYLLALARNSGADYLFSGDLDLRDLEERRYLPVGTPLRRFSFAATKTVSPGSYASLVLRPWRRFGPRGTPQGILCARAPRRGAAGRGLEVSGAFGEEIALWEDVGTSTR